jgi:hypothetical protein
VDPPEVALIEPTLEGFQAIVGKGDGCLLEWVRIGPHVGLYCDEEGMFHNLPPNRCGMLGSFVVTAMGHNGDERSLTDEEVRKVLAFCEFRKHQLHPSLTGQDCGPTITTYGSMEELQAELGVRADSRRVQWDAM